MKYFSCVLPSSLVIFITRKFWLYFSYVVDFTVVIVQFLKLFIRLIFIFSINNIVNRTCMQIWFSWIIYSCVFFSGSRMEWSEWNGIEWNDSHCLKSVRIRRYPGLYFPHIFPHSNRMQKDTEYWGRYGNNADQSNSKQGHFLCSEFLFTFPLTLCMSHR